MADTYTSSTGDSQKTNGGIVDRVKETAAAQLATQKDRGTDALGRVADAVRSSTQKLRDEQHETIAGYVDKAADQIDTWSRRIKEKDVQELVSDVQRLARRQPAVFIGSAFALGLVGARFLKSSRPQNEFRDSGRFTMADATLERPVTPSSAVGTERSPRPNRGRKTALRTESDDGR